MSGFIQNDFDKMLEDEIINKEDLLNSVADIDIHFNDTIKKLTDLKEKTKKIIKLYI